MEIRFFFKILNKRKMINRNFCEPFFMFIDSLVWSYSPVHFCSFIENITISSKIEILAHESSLYRINSIFHFSQFICLLYRSVFTLITNQLTEKRIKIIQDDFRDNQQIQASITPNITELKHQKILLSETRFFYSR